VLFMRTAGHSFDSLKRHGKLYEQPVKGGSRAANENGIVVMTKKTNPILPI
jgi:hypothetical protein